METDPKTFSRAYKKNLERHNITTRKHLSQLGYSDGDHWHWLEVDTLKIVYTKSNKGRRSFSVSNESKEKAKQPEEKGTSAAVATIVKNSTTEQKSKIREASSSSEGTNSGSADDSDEDGDIEALNWSACPDTSTVAGGGDNATEETFAVQEHSKEFHFELQPQPCSFIEEMVLEIEACPSQDFSVSDQKHVQRFRKQETFYDSESFAGTLLNDEDKQWQSILSEILISEIDFCGD